MQALDQPRTDHDSSSAESIKLEQNSKGVNVSVRCVRQPGESLDDWIARTVYAYRKSRTEATRL